MFEDVFEDRHSVRYDKGKLICTRLNGITPMLEPHIDVLNPHSAQ